MNSNYSDSENSNIKMVLVVPYGKEPEILPWGVFFIADYIKAYMPEINIDILNLSSDDDEIDKFFEKHYETTNRIQSYLLPTAREIFQGESSYLGTVASLGERFIDIVMANQMLKFGSRFFHSTKKDRKLLADMSMEFENLLVKKIHSMCLENDKNPVIWGISTFDRTVFSSLHITKCIRKYSNPFAVIMGGDYWDFNSAWKLMSSSNTAGVDGVVVGYGEGVVYNILDQFAKNKNIVFDELRIAGLVNKWTVKNEMKRSNLFATKREVEIAKTTDQQQTQSFSSPYEYLKDSRFPFKIAHTFPYGEDIMAIKILTQRGCSWGICEFCSQINKKLLFEFPANVVGKEIEECIAKIPMDKKIIILIDNDDISNDMLTFLIDLFSKYSNRIIEVWMWLQVKLVNEDILTVLHKSGNAAKYMLVLNWESMNPKTLELMKKGHTPLDNIAATKGVLDLGAMHFSNYLYWYPGETDENKKVEVKMLSSVLHLDMGMGLCKYRASRRDNIFKRADSFGIKIMRNPSDIWIREVFHCDLEYSFLNYTWKTRLFTKNFKIVPVLFEYVDENKGTIWFRPLFFLMKIFASISGKSAILKFIKILFLKDNPHSPDNADGQSNTDRISDTHAEKFYIQKERLIKKSGKIVTETELDDADIALLRAAYWPINESDLIEASVVSNNKATITSSLHRMESLGAIVRNGNCVVSVVNDKEYWTGRFKSA